MPWIVAIFMSALIEIAGSLVGRVILALGFGFVEYLGFSALVDNVKSQAAGLIEQVGASMLADWAGFFRIDIHLSILLSAIGVKILMNGLGSPRVRRMVQK